MHSKYDNMHPNEMFYALICTNNHIITCINCVLSRSRPREEHFLMLNLVVEKGASKDLNLIFYAQS